MTTPFAAAAADAAAAIDGWFGEAFRVTAWLPVSGQRVAPIEDPSRPALDVVGVWLPNPELRGVSPKLNNAEAVAQKPGWQGQGIGILVSATGLLWRPVPGDRVTRLDTAETFAVFRIADRGHGRLAIMLTR